VVGNISVGGTGKTPVVLAIAKHLEQLGWHCGIILRGYSRRHAETPMIIEDAKDHLRQVAVEGADVVSDEATILARRSGLPVYISAKRAVAAHSLLRDHAEVDVIICDDGLQHYALGRDVEICVIDGERGLGNGALLPAGPLREPVTRLNEVDVIVMNRTAMTDPLNPGHAIPGVPTFAMTLGNESLLRVMDGHAMSIEQGVAEFSTKRVFAVAGIGNPARFFAHLAGLGFQPAESRAFPDHHPFTPNDFKSTDAGIILMTEKDAVKCRAFADERMWFMRVDAVFPDAFGEFVVKRLSELKK
jgi:tetraacyldisaccharide 4'-kinase